MVTKHEYKCVKCVLLLEVESLQVLPTLLVPIIAFSGLLFFYTLQH